MKIVTACVAHETNTFAVTPTTLADFGQQPPGPEFPAGAPIVRNFAGTRTVHGGAFDVANRLGATVEPLLWVFATPGGMVESAAYDYLVGLLCDRLAQHPDADGFLFELHGAMVTEAHEDGEAAMLRAVREVVGDLPIVAVTDLHANLSAALIEQVQVLVGYDLYPHTDLYERGVEAMTLLDRIVRGELRPTPAFRQLPLMTMPPRQCTLVSPMRDLLEQAWAIEAEPGVLNATIAMGFPYADIHDAGVSVLVTTDNDPELAAARADALAEAIWARRDEFEPDLVPVDAVIRYVKRRSEGLVVLADGSDNPGGGAPCDGTVILEALLEADVQDAVVAAIADSETAYQAHEAGVGATIVARLGAKTDEWHGRTLEVEAYVKLLSDGEFTYRAEMSAGRQGQLGPTAVLEIGGVSVIVTSYRTQVMDPEILRCVGIEPAEQRLVALKSAVHFRAAFGPLAERIFDADTPGVHRPDFAQYPYQRVRRPIYPLDPETTFALPRETPA